MLYRTGS